MTACARCASPLEHGDLRCAVCALPVPAPAVHAVVAERARVLRCRECNAAVAFAPDARAPRCAFCGAVMAVEQLEDPLEEARLRVPFAVHREVATGSLRGWLATRGWFAPRALANEAVVDSLAPLYWASWLVDARVTATWTADSNADSRRSAWAPHAGQFVTDCRNLVIPASRGLTLAECSALVPSYDVARAVALAPDTHAVDDAVVESFDAQRSAARALVHGWIERAARVAAEPHIPGTRFRNVHVACLVEAQTTERIALPAWVLAYRFKGKAYRAVIHGQRAGVVIGKAPVDLRKVAVVVVGVLAVIAAIAGYALLIMPADRDRRSRALRCRCRMSRARSVWMLRPMRAVAGCAGSPAIAPVATPPSPPAATSPATTPVAVPHALPAICATDLSAWSPSAGPFVPGATAIQALRPAVLALQARVCACAATAALPRRWASRCSPSLREGERR